MNLKLDAREKRSLQIKTFFQQNPNDSLIVIKTNMPSNLTNKPIAYYLVKIFLNDLKYHIPFQSATMYESEDGPYILLKINDKDIEIKKYLIQFEENHQLGRLIDLDYFVEPNKSIYRNELGYPQRKCFLCNKDAFICIKEKNHSPEEIEDFINNTFINFMKDYIENLVDFSLLRELDLEDKFGLVTPTTSGNHKDMDYDLMVGAKDAILPFFPMFLQLGYETKDLSTLLKDVRKLGIEAEEKMFLETNGINAYKGIIFLMGTVCLALGYTLKYNNTFDDLFNNIKLLTKDIYDDFKIYNNTFTTSLYKERKIAGIREVVKDGLNIVKINLENISPTSEDEELRTLLYNYILTSDDTVFIKRSLSYEFYQKHKSVLKTLNPYNEKDILTINEYSKKHNLSFGGSADLLIVSIFLSHIKELYI